MALVGIWCLSQAAAGCDPLGYDDHESVLANVDSVAVPAKVSPGETYAVMVHSHGTNGCWRKGRTLGGRIGGNEVKIVPFDLRPRGEQVCTANIVNFRHEVRVTAAPGGTDHVRVLTYLRGAGGQDSSGVIELPVTIE